MTINVAVKPIPTGGAIMLDFLQGAATSALQGTVTISRVVNGGSPVQIWTGPAAEMNYFIDANDGSAGPLQSGSQYAYAITDQSGSYTTPAVSPVSQFAVIQNSDVAFMVRLFEAAVATIAVPSTITKRPSVTNAMPITGTPPLPMIAVNLDLVQQEDIPIGQDVGAPNPDLTITLGGYAKWMWRLSILCSDAPARDFWRDAVIAIFQALCPSVFAPIGRNISHKYQAASYQVVNESKNLSPGFYGADVLLEIEGVLNTTLTTNIQLIETIDFTATFPDAVTQAAQVPLSH